jgi:hypothetical protein
LPVSGGSHAHQAPLVATGADDAARNPSAPHGSATGHGLAADGKAGVGEIWPDLTRKEALTLFPLAVLTIVTGVYPAPVFAIVEPAFARILAAFQ